MYLLCYIIIVGTIIGTSDDNNTPVVNGVSSTTAELKLTSVLTSQAGLYTCEATLSLFSEDDVTLYELVELQVRSKHILIGVAVLP